MTSRLSQARRVTTGVAVSVALSLTLGACAKRSEPSVPTTIPPATAGESSTQPTAGTPNSLAGTAAPGTASPGSRIAPQAIREVDFANFTFPTDSCGDIFESAPVEGYPLTNGEAHRGTPADPDFYAVYLRNDISYGDLDDDGVEEAVVILDCTPGNRPFGFGSVWRATQDGGASRAAKIESAGVDPGRGELRIYEATISGGAVEVTWQVFGADDASCCPSELATIRLRLSGNRLEPAGPAEYESAPLPG
ncbi:MAG: hypothetical protein N2037_06760 [Acidimicrobiales bacterium]|nr:hypothetical protein [Acidimicrobiales bacterium]